MTRVYAPRDETPLFIPSAWTVWLYLGDRFRRNHVDGRVEMLCRDDLWWPCVEEDITRQEGEESACNQERGAYG